MATLCDLATRLPLVIGGLLDREANLKRGRFREETMTDILTGALAAFAGPELVISYPIEKDTGGDLDLRFWNVSEGRDLWVRIQAKRLNAAGVQNKNRSYSELLHRPSPKHEYQFRTLRDTPPPWVPLYLFYNHASVTMDPSFRGLVPSVSGANLAFASDIAAELEAKLAGASGTPKTGALNKRLSHLRPHFFGLEALLCPRSTVRSETVPTPDTVSAFLREQYVRSRPARPRERYGDEIFRRLSEPHELMTADGIGRTLQDGPAVRIDRQLDYPLVTFISGRTGDSRTPAISDVPPQRG
ncbi:DUF6615 family protein [Mesorhizobium sp.]|uniref:DUF6615 family protein n=1 Tax=Mesorhizobium sp. TaxID=1871066 RepID=UPI00269AD3D3